MQNIKNSRPIYCIQCEMEVPAYLVTGRDVYPSRSDLYTLMFWRCPICGNCVGTHKKSGIPLGSIPTKEIKVLRHKIHEIVDPLWQNNIIRRKDLYSYISNKLGKEYHTAEINSVQEADHILNIISKMICENYSQYYFWTGTEFVFVGNS